VRQRRRRTEPIAQLADGLRQPLFGHRREHETVGPHDTLPRRAPLLRGATIKGLDTDARSFIRIASRIMAVACGLRSAS
jgi:hypothetical protein